MYRIVFSGFVKVLPEYKNKILNVQKVKIEIPNYIKTELQFGIQIFSLLKAYLWNIKIAKDNNWHESLWVCWLYSQGLIEQINIALTCPHLTINNSLENLLW